jgi:hypothetical protein
LPGPIGYGGICNINKIETRCQKDLICLYLSGGDGFCSQFCTSACPSGAACREIQIDNQKKYACIFPCTACPSGLKCYQQYDACFP